MVAFRLRDYLEIIYIFIDDTFFNWNWPGACGGHWAGPGLFEGWDAGVWIVWVEVGSCGGLY